MSSAVRADLLDPFAFASLGTLAPFTGGIGSVVIDTSAATFTVNGTGSSAQTYHGVISNGVAVFDFTAVDLPVFISAQGSHPLAILSRGDMTLGTLAAAPPSNTSALQVPGGGPGGGAPGGAPGFDPPPSIAGNPGASGAKDPLTTLAGGANGDGNFGSSGPFGQKGQGGPAIELVAAGDLLAGTIDANGARGEDAFGFFFPGGGGGGGGAVILAGDFVSGIVDVSGGAGGHGGFVGMGIPPSNPDPAGGGGGGGVVDIFYRSGYSVTANVAGGAPGGDNGDQIKAQPGAYGQVNVVPEPSSFVQLGAALAVLSILGRRTRRVLGADVR